ncbi:MAG: M48 family metalloprotease [Desulfobacterales bacterium]|jgi:predicted Zn-dependent protease|nr:M48 family metalloprotease [Desulfobacterales bacterium]
MVLTAITMFSGCTAPGALRFTEETRIERLTQLLSFEARREQAAIARQCVLYRDPQMERFIEQVIVTLMTDDPNQVYMPKVILVKDTTLNAYSFPDGAIYIHTGLLARLEHESELALLLAHEIVHITRQHALQVATLSQREADGSFTGRELSDSLSWFRDMAPAQGNSGSMDTMQDLRRSLEQDADRAGLDMLIKANYDPYKAFEIFEHLKSGAGAEETDERADRMSKMLSSAALDAAGRPSDPIAFSKRLHPLLVSQLELEIQRGEWESALGCARRLLKEDPENARVHYLLGELYRQRDEPGDEHRAMGHHDRAIVSDPFYPEPRKAAGLLYLKQGQARAARTFFQNALDLSPQSNDNAYIRNYLTQCSTLIEGETP